MRFSLKSLLAATTLVALGCVGVLCANAIWSALFTTAAFLSVLFGIVAAMLRHGRARAFWIGFSVFGAGYFGLATFGERDAVSSVRSISRLLAQGPTRINESGVAEPRLATTAFLIWADRYLEPLREKPDPSNLISARDGTVLRVASNQAVALNLIGVNLDFVTIGHGLFTLALSVVGGLVGFWFAEREPPLPNDDDAALS
jgi:hypothetical protein